MQTNSPLIHAFGTGPNRLHALCGSHPLEDGDEPATDVHAEVTCPACLRYWPAPGTRINYCGSKWAGELPNTVDQLIEVMQTYALDPTFEAYGNFGANGPAGSATVRFWGNFYTLSHVFSIDTDDPELCARLITAIKANQSTQAYQDAKREIAEAKIAETTRQATRQRALRRWRA